MAHLSLYDYPRPAWAIDLAHGEYVKGAQLPTKDGRRYGNSHIISVSDDGKFFNCITDAGTVFIADLALLRELFHPPEYISDVNEVISKFYRGDEPFNFSF